MQALLLFVTALALLQAPPPTKAEQLQEAARKGDAVTVKRLLDDGLDVNTKYRYGATALFFACDAGHVDVVKVLLDKGADLTVKDTFYGMTPLMMAVQPARKKTPAHNEIAKLLVAKGAPQREMALGAAVAEDDEALAKAVLDTGPVAASALSDALETARAGKKVKTMALLEAAGAKPYEDFPIAAEQLAQFAGTYRNPAGNEMVVAVDGKRLKLGNAAAGAAGQRTLVAQDATTFRGINVQGTTIVFKIESGKVTGFDVKPAQGNPVSYARVEGK